jgi:hypothetical protein
MINEPGGGASAGRGRPVRDDTNYKDEKSPCKLKKKDFSPTVKLSRELIVMISVRFCDFTVKDGDFQQEIRQQSVAAALCKFVVIAKVTAVRSSFRTVAA